MRIERIQVEGFGRLRDVDTGSAPLDGLVVILGPNEAGKSTLFTFLTTALYGFQPATRDRNPHVPWGADQAAGRVRVRLDAGGCAEVERRLRSTPSARLTAHGTVSEMHNRPLPWVEHVPRAVFRQVFAITLSELAALDPETWARIQDNVVGSMGASDLASARALAEELEREAGEIWRPNRRGNQRLRDLQTGIRDSRAQRLAAYERDARIRQLTEDSEQVRSRLQRAKEERQRDRLTLERTQSLVPLKQRLDRIAALRAEAGERSELDGLPADPAGLLAAHEAERTSLEARRAAFETERAERASVVAAFDEHARRLVAHRDRIVSLVARAAALAPDRARAAELEAEVGRLEHEERLTRARLDVAPPRGAAPPSDSGAPVGAALAAVGLGGALLAWGVIGGVTALTVAGAALAGIGFALFVTQGTARRSARTAVPAPAAPGEEDRRRLAALARTRELRAEALAAARGRIADAEREAEALSDAIGHEGAGARTTDGGAADGPGRAGAEATAHSLDQGLRRGERLETAAMSAEHEVRRLTREIEALERSRASSEGPLAELRERGRRLGGGNATVGLERARARLTALRRADEMEEELERAHPNRRELEQRLARDEGGPPLGDEALARSRARLEELEDEVEGLLQRSEALSVEIAGLRELETVDAVDGEIASMKEAEASLVRERDRKWILAKLLREADRRFREEHQPDLLRRASSYLAHLTGGRYDRLLVDETSSAHLFQVVGPGLPAPIALAEPVSTGTLEQAYLSLRLAIVDHLDRGGERLPLFVDEVFVNWDDERRARGLEVLAGLSTQRQVFVFTCHPSVADELASRGARVVALGPNG